MPTIIRRMEFDAGHRVLRHESKCKHLHGHRYVCLLHVSCDRHEMDALGRVIDFGVVKDLVGRWIDDHLDHNMILHPEDPLLKDQEFDGRFVSGIDFAKSLVGRHPFVMPADMPNPTAENIAQVILTEAKRLIHSLTAIRVCGIELYETPNCSVRIFDEDESTAPRED